MRTANGAKRFRIVKSTSPLLPIMAPPVQLPDGEAGDGTEPEAPLLRYELGQVLRAVRLRQHRTLREVSAAAKVSLGYLSEVERGQKEASSELLASICQALAMPLWATLREASDRIAAQEGAWIPDTPEALLDDSHPLAMR